MDYHSRMAIEQVLAVVWYLSVAVIMSPDENHICVEVFVKLELNLYFSCVLGWGWNEIELIPVTFVTLL